MTMPNNHTEMLIQAHRNSTNGFANYSGLPVIHPDRSLAFDEPPPPYANNSLSISPLSDVFPQSALLHTDSLLNAEPITYSPLAPVPLRHSSLYQVLNQESPASPAQGTLSGTSSIAHALEPQESQSRQVSPLSTPVLKNTRGSMIGTSESALLTSQITTTSLSAVAADPCPHLPEDPTTATSAQALSPVSSTPPCTSVPAQKGSVVTSLQAHTLVLSQPEVTTHDYDTFPRLRKVSYPLPLAPRKDAVLIRLRKSSRLIQLQPGFATEGHSAASSPLSPLPSRPSSSMGAPASSSSLDSNTGVNSSFTLPLLGRKRPVLRAKLACLFCRRRKIKCRPLPGDHLGSTCQLVFFSLQGSAGICGADHPHSVLCRQCVKRCRKCEYPETTRRGRGRNWSRGDLDESDYDEEEEEEPPSRSKSRRGA
jgi:hypothetical protein